MFQRFASARSVHPICMETERRCCAALLLWYLLLRLLRRLTPAYTSKDRITWIWYSYYVVLLTWNPAGLAFRIQCRYLRTTHFPSGWSDFGKRIGTDWKQPNNRTQKSEVPYGTTSLSVSYLPYIQKRFARATEAAEHDVGSSFVGGSPVPSNS
jgi:hypothetical protein